MKMIKRWLFLDDTEARHNIFRALVHQLWYANPISIDYVWSADEAIQRLKTARYDCVWLDHDLEETDPQHMGMVVADFIALHQDPSLRPREVVVHSWNNYAAPEMVARLKGAGINAKRVAFTSSS